VHDSGVPIGVLSEAYLAALAWTTETSRAADDPAG
jgi:hypothetical protein